MTVLVVDDCINERGALKFLLETCNYSVLEASDGEAAVRIAKEQLPELIIMDLMMPVMDGFEAIRQLRECAETKHLTIIALSTNCSDQEWRDKAMQSGADGWLTKLADFGKLEKLLGH